MKFCHLQHFSGCDYNSWLVRSTSSQPAQPLIIFVVQILSKYLRFLLISNCGILFHYSASPNFNSSPSPLSFVDGCTMARPETRVDRCLSLESPISSLPGWSCPPEAWEVSLVVNECDRACWRVSSACHMVNLFLRAMGPFTAGFINLPCILHKKRAV